MTSITAQWRNGFNTALQAHFTITISDAGLSESELARYTDLDTKAAALQFGEDYDLAWVDQGWR